MKKTLIGLFLILGAVSFATVGKIEAKGGLDFGGKYNYGQNYKSQKSKAGSGKFGAEYRYEVIPGLELGGGTAFQFHKDLKDKVKGQNEKNFNSVPVYGTAKYKFDTPIAVKPYIKGDLGYSFNSGNYENARTGKFKAKNGAYYGVGGGIDFNNLSVELMFKENKGKYEHEGSLGPKSKYNTNYRRVTLGIGYDFNLGN